MDEESKSDLAINDGFVTYRPLCGTHIGNACKEAIDLAIESDSPVVFTFNDIEIKAYETSTVEELCQKYSYETKVRAEAWHRTQEYKDQQDKRNLEVAEKSWQVLELFKKLDLIIEKCFIAKVMKDRGITLTLERSQEELLNWMELFVPLADDIAIEFDKELLISKLNKAGFFENEEVGRNPDWFDTRDKMARYIIGQVIGCLKSGMPPHPMTVSFIEKYRELPRK
jgi:hypothetical protein